MPSNHRQLMVACLLLVGCSRGGMPDTLSTFTIGVFEAYVTYDDLDLNGVIEGDEGVGITVIAYDDDGSRCNEVSSDIRVEVDGMRMEQVSDGSGFFDVLNGFQCGSDPTWSVGGIDLLDPDLEVSMVTLTDDETTFTFELPGLRQPPTLTFEGADPTAFAPRTPVTAVFGPEGLQADAEGRLWMRQDAGLPDYTVCATGDCDRTATIDGNRWSFTTPDFCAAGTYLLRQPVRWIRATCPHAFGYCQRDPVVGVADFTFDAGQLEVVDDGLLPPCEVTLPDLTFGAIEENLAVHVVDLVVTSPPDRTSVFAEDLTNPLFGGAVRLDFDAAVTLPSPGDLLDVRSVYEVLNEGEGRARRLYVAQEEDLTRRGAAPDFELEQSVGPLSWQGPADLHDEFGVRSQSLGLVAEVAAGGFLLDSRLGDTIEVESPWIDVAAGVAVGDDLLVSGIVRIDEAGQYVLSPRWSEDLADAP